MTSEPDYTSDDLSTSETAKKLQGIIKGSRYYESK